MVGSLGVYILFVCTGELLAESMYAEGRSYSCVCAGSVHQCWG